MKWLMGKSFLLFSVSVIVMEGNGCEGHATRSCQFFYAHLLSARFSFFFLPTQSASYAHGITAFVEHFIKCSLAPKTLLIFIALTTVVPVRSRSQNRPLLRLQFNKSLWTSKSSPKPQKHTSDQSPLFLSGPGGRSDGECHRQSRSASGIHFGYEPLTMILLASSSLRCCHHRGL